MGKGETAGTEGYVLNPVTPDWNALHAQAKAEAASRLAAETAMAAAIPEIVAALEEMLTHEPERTATYSGECSGTSR